MYVLAIILTIALLIMKSLLADCRCCTSGFPPLEQLLTANNIELQEECPLQGIFPTLLFTCDGTLTRLIYRTNFDGAEFGRSELFEVWRVNATNPSISNALSPPISTRRNEVLFRNISSNASLYSVGNLNISIQANDYLGIAQLVPSTMHFQRIEGMTPVYYYRRSLASSFNLAEEEAEADSLVPLITAVISRKKSVSYPKSLVHNYKFQTNVPCIGRSNGPTSLN